MIPLTVADDIQTTLLDYLTTTFNLQDKTVEQALVGFLTQPEGKGMFQGPYLSVRLPFQKVGTGTQLHDLLDIAPPLTPYAHQAQAFARLSSRNGRTPQPTLITTGTGSGKTECFLYPILDHCYRHRDKRGIKAIILYPMNALAADQARRLAGIIWGDERLRGQISAGLYVGGSSEVAHTTMGPETLIDDRQTLRENPPDILLTNYRMLDFLLLRPEDKPLWRFNQPDSLRYLVLDELHTYDGAQGSDVACLIRRLRARLHTVEDGLCPVGTSATVVSQSGDTVKALTDFASQIFATNFPADAVIGEARESLHTFLPETAEAGDLPPDLTALAERPGEAYEAYLTRQLQAWFPQQPDLTSVPLAAALRRHPLLRALLTVMNDEALHLTTVCQRLSRWEPALANRTPAEQQTIVVSFLSLISAARELDGGRERPFLTVQSQLWVREMSRLMRQVSDSPQFFWRDDIPSDKLPLGLPAYVCRECGHSGWLAIRREGDNHLTGDTQTIYNHYFDRHRSTIYLYPPGPIQERLIPDRLCPHCLSIGSREKCDVCQTPTFPVILYREQSQPRGQQKPRDLQRCPICATDGSLGILGRQAASLLSVAISHLFTSPLNQDNKLLAFTDSVQDAAHRAAFFGARTYRFNIRTAFQTVLEEAQTNGESLSLDRFTDTLLEYWRARWQTAAGPAVGQKLLAAFMPPDLQELAAYQQYMTGSAQPVPADLEHDLRRRLSWEATMEFGFNARVGRSLEKVGSSTAYLPQERLQPAQERLAQILREEINLLKTTTPDDIGRFVLGLLERTRLRGGVVHDMLHSYIRDQGNWFLLTKRRQPLLSPFGKHSPRFPRFLIESSGRDVFDQFITRGSQATWFIDWARRALSPDLGIADINEIYRLMMPVLVDAHLLAAVPAGQSTAYGLRPETLILTATTTVLRCDHCGQRQTVTPVETAVWQEMACLNFRCQGHYQPVDQAELAAEGSYYQALYAQGQVARIFSQEHTGLLERERREAIEIGFKTQNRADAPNLLTATPTLEMGIDVGDLSATIACAVPPTTANYLQRIGRAGRATGNSFIMALANVRPHDLTYFEQPLEMIAGAIIPPGCYLDAPNMLQRQFLAFGMDTWAATSPEATQLPRNVKEMLARLKRGGFPLNLMAYYNQHKHELIDRFLALFGPVVAPANQQLLHDFAAGEALPALVEQAVNAVDEERQALRNTYKTLRRERNQIEENPAQYDEPEKQIAELNQELALINQTIGILQDKYILNFFTDAGLLPNYAFPETGVALTAVITGIEAADTEKRYLVREYLRPAPVAIRELAPFNTFYAEGRKLMINSLNMRGQDTVVERWQFCSRCAQMSPVAATHYATTCPQCGSELWHDVGQQHNMIRLREVTARTDHQQSLTSDDGEERQQERYETGLYFEVNRDTSQGAFLIPDLPFGIEALQQVTLREINFGFHSSFGHPMLVAGEEKPESGFQVCPGCGVVRDSRQHEAEREQVRHTRSCPIARQEKKEIPWDNLYLYREMTSEALRILLPVSTVLVTEKLTTFQACLNLGLRQMFQGDPDHIRIAPASEVTPDGTRQRFLMMYDTVPGGTSYLRDLAQPEVFQELLRLALAVLTSCPCRLDEHKQACYRCLYAYESQYDKENISRQAGVELLQEILAHWPALVPVPSLSGVDMVSLLESELEQRFIDVLQTAAQRRSDMQWQTKLYKGKEAWRLIIQQQEWLIEPQVTLGQWQGITTTSRPDFVCWPQGTLARTAQPVAVFTDGFAYHVQPQLRPGRLPDDIVKRQALLASGKFQIWSVTWDDVQEFENDDAYTSPFLTRTQHQQLKQFGRQLAIEGLEPAIDTNAVAQLLEYLAHPHKDDWLKLAGVLSLAQMIPPRPPVAATVVNHLAQILQTSPQRPHLNLEENTPAGQQMYAIAEVNCLQLLTHAPQQALGAGDAAAIETILRLDDTQANRQEVNFKTDWRQFLLLLNLYQFSPNLTAVTTEGAQIAEPPTVGTEPISALDAAVDTIPSLADWLPDYDLADPAGQPLLQALAAAQVPAPVVGYELTDSAGRVVAEAELAWQALETAVFRPEQAEDRDRFNQAGWQTFQISEQDALLTRLTAAA